MNTEIRNDPQLIAGLNGINWLSSQEDLKASPIGLYFALLWYDEKLYPLIYEAEVYRRLLTN